MNNLESFIPGPILLFGSGETLPSSGKAYEHLAKGLEKKPSISILETPAGFEPNSEMVANNIRDFLVRRLQNYDPQVNLIPARKKGTLFSPDNPEILFPLMRSNWLFMGPGSPTYAVNQLRDSLAYLYIKSAHLLGASMTLASAAVLAMSTHTLPVYEIYKVGEDLHWKDGLDYFSIFGLKLVFIPHWNNSDGGTELDTSRCFMGKSRFKILMDRLPGDVIIIGIDEQTALCFDFHIPSSCQVFGKGNMTIIKSSKERLISNGQELSLAELEGFHLPNIDDHIPAELKKQFLDSATESGVKLPDEIRELVAAREEARENKDWKASDELRGTIESRGWAVKDTPNGPDIEHLHN